MRVTAALGLLLVAVGCTSAPEAGWAGTIEERDGVVWVNNPAGDPLGEAASPAFSLQLEQTFGAEEEPDEALLAFVTAATVDGAGNVYVVDRGSDQLVGFGPGGQVLWRSGRAGEGPGEFENSNYIAWDGDGLLYVDNRNGGQIDTWTTAGEYVGSQRLASFDISQGFVVGLPDPSTIALWEMSRTDGDGAVVHVFDVGEQWARTAEFFALGGRRAETAEATFWGTPTVRTVGDSVWIGNSLRYELREYTRDGTLKRVIAREHPELIPTFVYRGTGFGTGSFDPPLWLSPKRGLVARSWLVGIQDVEEFKRRWDQYLASGDPDQSVFSYDSAIDLIDGDGRVLGSLPIAGAMWESLGTLVGVDPDGRLYTRVHDPYPHIRRYRVDMSGSTPPGQ